MAVKYHFILKKGEIGSLKIAKLIRKSADTDPNAIYICDSYDPEEGGCEIYEGYALSQALDVAEWLVSIGATTEYYRVDYSNVTPERLEWFYQHNLGLSTDGNNGSSWGSLL